MKSFKLLQWLVPSLFVTFDGKGGTDRSNALLVSHASTLVASLQCEVAVLGEINRRLSTENELLRAHTGLSPDCVQPSAVQIRDHTLHTWDSLASENAALLESVDALEAEQSVLKQINQKLATDNALLEDQRKRAMADQWMLKQINAALEKELSDLETPAQALAER